MITIRIVPINSLLALRLRSGGAAGYLAWARDGMESRVGNQKGYFPRSRSKNLLKVGKRIETDISCGSESKTRTTSHSAAGLWHRSEINVETINTPSFELNNVFPATCEYLLTAFLNGDLLALRILSDCLEEKGLGMLPAKAGEKYLVETPRWYYCGEISEVGPLWIKFSSGIQIHFIGDFTKAIEKGKFSKDSEISPVPTEFVLPSWMIMNLIKWDHAIPMQRTHSEKE